MPEKRAILCVDDDADILDFMKVLLSSKGCTVLTAGSGTQGLALAHREKPDIILLDVTMPDMNGYDVCAKLQEREETAYIPVIMVTALDTEKDKIRALRAGAADYMVKPI